MRNYQQLIWLKIKICGILATTTVLSCINAIPAWAETKSFHFTISSNGDQNFQTLVQQAESLASNSIKQGFAENSSITEVSVTVVGENNGQEVPLLFVTASRSNWQAEPKVKRWTRYFSTAVLLGFLNPQNPQATSRVKRTIASKSTKSKLEAEPGFRDD